jgi:hypothetical protein
MEAEKSRAQRRANTINVVKKQTAIARSHGAKVTEPGLFKKSHALDCGQPNCLVCGNPRRQNPHNKTIQELRSEAGFEKIEISDLAPE